MTSSSAFLLSFVVLGLAATASGVAVPQESPGIPAPLGDPAPPHPGTRTAECSVTWKAGSDICAKKGPGPCTTLYQGDHVTLDEAKRQCEHTHGAGKTEVISCGPCQWDRSGISTTCEKACDTESTTCEEQCAKKDDKDARISCQRQCNIAYASCAQKCKG